MSALTQTVDGDHCTHAANEICIKRGSWTRTKYSYDDSERLSTVTKTGLTASYLYNGLGQRVEKTVNGTTTAFIYDEAGHLLGEYTPSGTLIAEHIWLNDRPIAVVTPTGTYYVHTDQLDTPRYITNSSKQLVWEWLSDPFGTSAPNQNPSGLGTFVYNLRMPGQIYDSETGHDYNYFRDYNPAIGRYVESDPIGLFGGVNMYVYTGGNPLVYIDRYGLCWIYSQSTGRLSHVDIYGNIDYVAYGYAGYGIFANDSNLQSVPNVGPLPQGYYTIGSEQTNYIHGGRVALLNSMRLTPDPSNEMFGRGGFLIHGSATNDTNRESSEGCPVLNKKIRNKIGTSKDNCFIVVP